jgi:hypothetical protein
MWEPRRLTTLWVSVACYRDSLTFLYPVLNVYIWYPYAGGKFRHIYAELFFRKVAYTRYDVEHTDFAVRLYVCVETYVLNFFTLFMNLIELRNEEGSY